MRCSLLIPWITTTVKCSRFVSSCISWHKFSSASMMWLESPGCIRTECLVKNRVKICTLLDFSVEPMLKYCQLSTMSQAKKNTQITHKIIISLELPPLIFFEPGFSFMHILKLPCILHLRKVSSLSGLLFRRSWAYVNGWTDKGNNNAS